jgi:hypothetical protein
MGDFNGYNPLWGSKTTTDKGKKLEDFLSQEGLCIFNDGTDTYLHPGNGSYLAIDLTVTDPSLLLDFSWKVHDELCGNDHFPIILESLNSTVGERPTRYQFDKADWSLYEQMCRKKIAKTPSTITKRPNNSSENIESSKNIETKSAHFLA